MMKFFAHFVLAVTATLAFANDCKLGIVDDTVSENDKAIIVKKHNEYRLQICNGQVSDQPRGINLKKLRWDDKLAVQAQQVANTCEFAHKLATDDRWTWVGQNIYTSMRIHSANWDHAIKVWFDEHKKYTYPSKSNASTGHYTQVVWHDTEVVGCGYTRWLVNQNEMDDLYVCNYGPGGNWPDKAPYEEGNSGCKDFN